MSMMDGLIEEELRTIVAHREDVASAWSDDEVIAEASRRVSARGRWEGSGNASPPLATSFCVSRSSPHPLPANSIGVHRRISFHSSCRCEG
jgi:hypothetical protein